MNNEPSQSDPIPASNCKEVPVTGRQKCIANRVRMWARKNNVPQRHVSNLVKMCLYDDFPRTKQWMNDLLYFAKSGYGGIPRVKKEDL